MNRKCPQKISLQSLFLFLCSVLMFQECRVYCWTHYTCWGWSMRPGRTGSRILNQLVRQWQICYNVRGNKNEKFNITRQFCSPFILAQNFFLFLQKSFAFPNAWKEPSNQISLNANIPNIWRRGGENGEKMFKKIYPWTIIWWIGKLVDIIVVDIIEKAHSLKRGKALLAFLQVFQL